MASIDHLAALIGQVYTSPTTALHQMQWHWGNIGSAVAGIAAAIAAIFAAIGAVKYGPAWFREARARQQAQTAAATEEANLARLKAKQITLERHRSLYGWSRGGLATFTVALVTSAEEMARARQELLAAAGSGYVILRVAEGADAEDGGNVSRANDLRQIIESQGLISRAPTTGEREALEVGLKELGIPTAAHA